MSNGSAADASAAAAASPIHRYPPPVALFPLPLSFISLSSHHVAWRGVASLFGQSQGRKFSTWGPEPEPETETETKPDPRVPQNGDSRLEAVDGG